MPPTGKVEESAVARYTPYVEELHEFFSSRSIPFGLPDQVAPFIERLHADCVFRDEMSSMVRAIIYRARDGLAPSELVDLILIAVGGEAAVEVQHPFRELLAFVDGVFRSRWHTVPDEAEPADEAQGSDVEANSDLSAPPSEPRSPTPLNPAAVRAAHPDTAVFSRAHGMSASQHEHPSSAKAVEQDEPAGRSPWSGTLLDSSYESEPSSRRWFWGLGFGALIAIFCAGLFFAQRTAVDMFQQRPARPGPMAVASQQAYGAVPRGSQALAPTPAAKPIVGAIPAKPTAGIRSGRTERSGAKPTSAARSRPAERTDSARPSAAIGVSPGMMRSRLIYAPRTEYPRIAKLAHVEGKVVVEAVVAKNGRVVHADVISGHRLLRGAALHAVRGRRYRPYLVNGKPSNVATIVTVDFRLRR